jgi:hypothetical protein
MTSCSRSAASGAVTLIQRFGGAAHLSQLS